MAENMPRQENRRYFVAVRHIRLSSENNACKCGNSPIVGATGSGLMGACYDRDIHWHNVDNCFFFGNCGNIGVSAENLS